MGNFGSKVKRALPCIFGEEDPDSNQPQLTNHRTIVGHADSAGPPQPMTGMSLKVNY